MRVIAIDASPRQGVVSRSVEAVASAAEAAGATVVRVSLSRLDIRTCTACGICRVSGCCKIDDDLRSLADEIACADGIVIGTRSFLTKSDSAITALLDRIGGYLEAPRQLTLPGIATRGALQPSVREARRAVIVTACSAPEPLATFFGYTTGPIRRLRRTFGAGGIRTLGSLAVTNTWRRSEMTDSARTQARCLGRILAGKI